jgi:membrane protein implicated in regulation of membrane protease activity
MVLDRVDMYTLRWPLEATYSIVWTIQLVSFTALSLAGVIGARRYLQSDAANVS